ncbi:hypothetical protein BK133_15275 [Paenibacillus sp. FSL H8-0548]|nr:hypothetical protein BK133_15275 [Paenibacillus sp. FSL H8-0548]
MFIYSAEKQMMRLIKKSYCANIILFVWMVTRHFYAALFTMKPAPERLHRVYSVLSAIESAS